MSTSPELRPVTCRLCEARCGVLARIQDGRLVDFQPDLDDPVSAGAACDAPRRSLATLAHPRRLTTPLRRMPDGQLSPVSWEEALHEIGAQLQRIRSRHGAQALGLYLGEGVQRSSRLLARSLAVGVGLGTPNILSEMANEAGPRLLVTEWMLGQATPLLPDLGRAHHVVLLGADPEETDWGPMVAGRTQKQALAHSRKTKGSKVVLASPRKGPISELCDSHLPILPGREGFFLLGLLSAIVRGGWTDEQYVRDYTVGIEALKAALEPWPVDRCARACGLEPAQLSGLALKLSRAAMGVVHAGHGCFDNSMGALGAWAWLALHSVTANTLRPGGLYAHGGPIDLDAAFQGAISSRAPQTRVGHHPLLLLQAPATALSDEVLSPGPDQLRALVVVDGDPILELPGSARNRQALAELELLVVLARAEGPGTAQAHWVLPVTHPWEQDDLMLLDTMLLPVDAVAFASAQVAAPAQVRPAEEVLRELFVASRSGLRSALGGLRGGAFGRHFGMGALALAPSDLAPWEQRLLSWAGDIELADLAAPPHRVVTGETNRANWRVSHPDGRIRLLPEAIARRLAALEEPRVDPAMPLLLRTSAPRQRLRDPLLGAPAGPAILAHPDCGIAAGQRVRVETRHGQVEGLLGHDPGLRVDTVDLPRGGGVDAMALLAADGCDPLSGAPERDGLACRLTAL